MDKDNLGKNSADRPAGITPLNFSDLLFDSLPDATAIVGEKGILSRVNARTAEMFGYTTDELLGTPFDSLISEGRVTEWKPNDESIGDVFTQRFQNNPKLLGRRKGGLEFPLEVKISTFGSGQTNEIIVAMRDISRLRTAENAALGSQEILHRLVEQVKEYAIFTLDPEGFITTWNLGAERIKGYKADEVLGKHFSMFYSAADNARKHPAVELETALRQGSYEEEGWRIRKDGSRFWADVVITPLFNNDGTHVGFAKVTRDMTEQKNAADRVQKLMQQREDFVATLTHDLKTPVFAASRAITLLLEGDFGPILPEQRQILSTIVESNEVMYRLLLTLLDVYRYDSGQKELCIAMHDLSVSVRKLVDEFRPLAESRKITITNLTTEESTMVPCDADEIRRVVQNLIDNALKFTPDSGHIEINIQQLDEDTIISVVDNGKGISDQDKPKLFERFWSAAEGKRLYASTGLGLYLCRKIVESHGGKIWCESTQHEGSKFSFTLPRSQHTFANSKDAN